MENRVAKYKKNKFVRWKVYITTEKTKLKQTDDNYILYNLLPYHPYQVPNIIKHAVEY